MFLTKNLSLRGKIRDELIFPENMILKIVCFCTIYFVLHFCPPSVQAGFNKVQLFLSDAVRCRVWWAVNGGSALGKRLVDGCSLAVGNTTSQTIISLLWVTKKSSTTKVILVWFSLLFKNSMTESLLKRKKVSDRLVLWW